MEKLEFDSSKYYKYDEIYTLLRQWKTEYPNEFSYEEIGKSYEKRKIWAVTLTAKTMQEPSEKPAYYIDANHHAGEVTGSSVALYTIDYLLSNYQKNKRVTRLLEDYTFYIIPRITVDGSEMYLTSPYLLRSSVREYSPHTKQGTIMKDMNGDGHILQMRVKSSTGSYKISPKDPRLMVKRQPDDIVGEFYDVLIEGEIEDYDGVEIKPSRTKWGLDFNRNYPMNWKPEIRQRGAGPYPLSEPETKAVAEFIYKHKNIAGIMSFHTSGGIILRPYCTQQDNELPKNDLLAYNILGDIGKELTSYPCWSIFEKFTVDKEKPSVGSFMDFAYDYLGIVTFATELWDLRGRAGLEKLDLKKWLKMTNAEEEEYGLALLKYSDEKHNGDLFINWQEYNHPQLGIVEIGGFRPKFGKQNPPFCLLEEECKKNMLFTFSHAESMPKLRITEADTLKVTDTVYKIIVKFENTGYLPTSGSEKAIVNKIANKIEAYINNEVVVLKGKHKQEYTQLSGYEKAKAEWLISAQSGDEINVVIKSERAGVVKQKIIVK